VLVKTCGAMASGIWYSEFQGSIAKDSFGMDVQMLGLVTSYMAGLGMLVQISGFVKFGSKFGDRVVNVFTAAVLGLTFAAAPFVAMLTKEAATCVGIPVPLLLLFIPLTAAFTLLRTVSTAAFTNVVASHQAGTVLGIDMGVGSAVRIVSPQVGSYMMKNYQFMGLGMLCAALCMLMSALAALTMAPPTPAEQVGAPLRTDGLLNRVTLSHAMRMCRLPRRRRSWTR
jgi:hypothetical protein